MSTERRRTGFRIAAARIVAACLAAALTACATDPPPDLNATLKGLIGGEAKTAVQIFGRPVSIHKEGGLIQYIWVTHAPAPQTAAGPAQRQARNKAGAELAASMKSNPTPNSAPPPQCALVMSVDGQHRIKTFRITGARDQCGPFAEAAARQ